jgi:penicillin-binding protein 1A
LVRPVTLSRPSLQTRIARRFLAADAAIDSGAYRFTAVFGRAWTWYTDQMSRLRVTGWLRGVVELLSEGATLGTAGSVVLLALAIPAFQATETDWRAHGEFAVTFLDRNDHEIGRRGLFLDDSVPLADIPNTLIMATLATEDRRFYQHFGIDVFGTFRAILTNAEAGEVVQGGSSLSQQLAKNLFLTNERTLERKIKEAYLALWLEANFTKDEILKLYLDRAYMGGGTFGVAAAAEFYFGKSVRDLTLAESAMLAGLFKAPTKYAPHIDLPAARARANQVLTNLVDAGFLSEGQVAIARRNPAEVVLTAREAVPDYFLDWAFEEVKRIGPPHRIVIARTTLDPTVQHGAETAIETTLRTSGRDADAGQAAMVIEDTEGAVRAMVGGRDYGESQFNRATQALRQPGSSFKPFVYAAAFMNGYTLDSVVPDAPISIGGWSPSNYAGSYSGPVTLRSALSRSINTVPVRLAEAIGRDVIVDLAYQMGLTHELLITRSLPLGAAEVTVIDMAGSYGSFAAGGIRTTPYAIREISTRAGEVLYDRARDEPPPPRVMPAEIAAEMNDGLHTAVESGTGRAARIEGVTIAGKTGTASEYRDAWFVGYSGNFVGAVWFGNDDHSPMNNITGGSLPARTWQAAMAVAHAGVPLRPLFGIDDGGLEGREGPQVAGGPSVDAPAARDTLTPAAVAIIAEIGTLMRDRGSPLVSLAAPVAPMAAAPAETTTPVRTNAVAVDPPTSAQRPVPSFEAAAEAEETPAPEAASAPPALVPLPAPPPGNLAELPPPEAGASALTAVR